MTEPTDDPMPYNINLQMQPNLIDMMYMVLQRPAMYCGKADIFLFELFYHGYALGRSNQDECRFMHSFEIWARKKHKKGSYPSSNGWAYMYNELAKVKQDKASREYPKDHHLIKSPSEDVALLLFRQDWEEFLSQTPPDQLPYEPERVKSQKPYRTIDDDWQDSTEKGVPKKNSPYPHPRKRKQVEENPPSP